MSDRLSSARIDELLPVLRERGFVTAYVGDDGEPLLFNTNHFTYNSKHAWHRVGKPEFPHPPGFEPPADLIEYLRQVHAGRFSAKTIEQECEKFGVSPLYIGATPTDHSQGVLPGTTPTDHSLGTPCRTDVRVQSAEYSRNTHLRACAREGDTGDAPLTSPPGPRGVCELCDTEPDTSTPDGETTAPDPAPEPPTAEAIPTLDETPAPPAPPAPVRKPTLEQQHPALASAIEGAYPQRRDRERRRILDCYLRELAAPGCLITEAQLVETMEADPPLAGGTPQQYLLHAQGRVTGRRSRDAPAAEADGGRERVGVEAVLAAAGVAEVDEGQVAQAAEHGQQVLARFRRRAGPGTGDEGSAQAPVF